MQDSTLLKLAIAVGLVGTVALALLSPKLEKSASNDTVEGEVVRVRHLENVALVDVKHTVTVAVFGNQTLGLSAGDYIKASGRLQQYRGKSELIAERIERTG